MYQHSDLQSKALKALIHRGEICWAGNRGQRIYGRLFCGSGKRMKRVNRVFFKTKDECKQLGYRPCGHCCREEYLEWCNKGLISSYLRAESHQVQSP